MDAVRARELAPLVAAQFAAGETIAELAQEWETGADAIEEMLRAELLRYIPRREGGWMEPRRREDAVRDEPEERQRGLDEVNGWLRAE